MKVIEPLYEVWCETCWQNTMKIHLNQTIGFVFKCEACGLKEKMRLLQAANLTDEEWELPVTTWRPADDDAA